MLNLPMELSVEREQESTGIHLTVGEAILGLLILGGALLRLITLADLPLSPDEAQEALAVAGFWSAADTPYAVLSPGWFTLTALLRPFIGLNDTAMRLIPALIGTSMLALPWLIRHRIGVVGALTTTALIAISPVLTMTSRTAGGNSLALFAGMLLFVAWVNYHDQVQEDEQKQTAWLMTGTVAIALGLLSSPLFYTCLLALAGMWGLDQFSSRSEQMHRASSAQLRNAGLVILGLIIGAGTMMMIVPAGLGAAANLPIQWLGQIGDWSNWMRSLQTLLYEAPLLIFGLPALAYGIWQGKNTGTNLTLWAMIGLLLTLLQGHHVENVAVVILPIYLLIGLMANRFFGRVNWLNTQVGIVAVLLFAWGILSLVNIGRYTQLPANNFAPLIIILLFFMLVSLVSFAVVRKPIQGVQGAALGLMLVCMFYGIGANWTLTHISGNHPREAWVDVGTDQNVRLMHDTLREASYQLTRADNEMPILSAVDSPVLRWYLRDFKALQFVSGIPVGTAGTAVISPESEPPMLDAAYTSASFDLLQTAVDDTPFDLTERLKWRFFRENTQPALRDRVTIWLYIGDK